MANTKEISTEEKWMGYYFQELQDKGFIKKLVYQPEPFILSDKIELAFMEQLKTKTKIHNKTLISKHIYTADFEIVWDTDKFHKDLGKDFYTEWPLFFSMMNRSFVEVKAIRDLQNMTRHFTSAIQPWIYQQYFIYVNLIKVPDIFRDSFIPEKIWNEMFYKVNGKKFRKGDPKFSWKYRTLNEYLTYKEEDGK